jgi:outer membrane receptor protein involved in Fe transport
VRKGLNNISLAALAVAIAGAPPAQAQTAANGKAQDQLEEIIVTAEKRSENLQNVPIAVDVVSGAKLQASGVLNVEDLGTLVAGFTVGDTNGSFQPRIRGVGTTSPGPGVESPVAVYVDGVYYASQAWRPGSLEDVAQISVLKGPQGTLFGRNATGGVVQITTLDPTSKFDGAFSTSLDNYLTTRSDLYLSGGLTPDLAANISVNYAYQGLGYGKDLDTGQAVDRFDRDIAVRSKFVYTPDQDTTIKVKIDYANRGGPDGSNITAIPGTSTLFPSLPTSPWDTSAYQATTYSFSGGGISVSAQHDLSVGQLANLVAYRQFTSQIRNLNSGLSSGLTESVDVPILGKQLSEELQLVSLPASPLKWATGIYYFYADDTVGTSPGLVLNFGGPLTAAPGSLGKIIINSDTVTNSLAGYGQATAKVAPATNLTLGLRYTYEHRSFEASETGFLTNGFSIGQFPLPPFAPSESFYKTTWRFALDHEFSSDATGYISYNRGFKSGGYNGFDPANEPYGPEQLDAYELGLKSSWLDDHLRVNSAAFYYDYKNIQVTKYTNTLVIYNGARAKLKGLDLNAEARFGNLKLSGGVEVLHAVFTSFPGAEYTIPLATGGAIVTTGDAAGNRLPYAPRFTGNVSLDYLHNLPGSSLIDFNVTEAHNSGYFVEADNRIHQAAFDMLNASITWSTPDDHYSLAIGATNLLDKPVIQYGASQSFGYFAAYGAPRIYSIKLTDRF